VLGQPRRTLPLLTLAVLGPVTAWQEAPLLGNHWLLVALVDLGLLLAAVAALEGWRVDRARLAAAFVPLARWSVVGFYSFAAFAKLNHAFFDTTVSCGSFYFDELARSLGFSTPISVGEGGVASLVPFGVAMTEASVPVLLLVRKTRNVGVLVALAFHGMIALDQLHLFSDFSSVLSALFVLFLPAAFFTDAVRFVRTRAPWAAALYAGAAAIVLIAQWSGRDGFIDTVFVDGRMWLWFVADFALIAGVVVWLRTTRGARLSHPLSLDRRARWLAIVPIVVIANGLTPYLELRTAYAYNMYSNLQTVGGSSNHLLVTATLPIGDRQGRLVRILASDDGGLEAYKVLGYDLPWDSLRAYLAKHPQASVTYERAGQVHALVHAADDPALVTAPSIVTQKLFPLRAVDQHDPPRCQDSFLPAL
jgi:hypothetical protein